MAPDAGNVHANSEKPSAPGLPDLSEFERIPDVNLFDSANRKLKVISIGAGVSGILAAYKLQKLAKNVEHKVYERNDDIGGTWLENRYPGVACDIPSHAYSFGFALNPEWPEFFSNAETIWHYLNRVCDCFGLRKYMTFNTTVTGCYWNEETSQWTVKMVQNSPGSDPVEIEDTCDFLLYGSGLLNNWQWPKIPGLDKFKGKLIHTAHWPKDYQEEQWKQDSVAVIGSGASSLQTVGTMQPHVKHMDIFVRTPIWFITFSGHNGFPIAYTEEEKETFRKDPERLAQEAKKYEDDLNSLWPIFFSGSEAQNGAREHFGALMAEEIKDPRLLEFFKPSWGIGCRRVSAGGPYMKAIQQDNVDVHITAAAELTEDGVLGEDGIERKVDTVICATGFDTTYRPRFPIIGRNGVNLQDKWAVCPEGYLGLLVPDMPNFLMFMGPTWPIENGSIMGPMDAVADYMVQLLAKMQNELISSVAPRQDVTDKFNAHVQNFIQGTVWTEDCRSWYKNNETGRVNAIWPGSSLHYIQTIKTPRYEDFEIKYRDDEHPWDFLGRGYTVNERTEGMDRSPYLHPDLIDPKWAEYASIKGSTGK